MHLVGIFHVQTCQLSLTHAIMLLVFYAWVNGIPLSFAVVLETITWRTEFGFPLPQLEQLHPM